MEIWTPLLITSLSVLFCAIVTIFIFRRIWKNESKIRNTFRNFSLSIFSTLFFLLILDAIFGVFVVQSDGYGFTLASQRWSQEHWNPINSNNYRDYNHDWKQNILFVVGDSFIAGHGIKNIDDRIAGVLAKKTGNDWTVAVLAQNGWSTAAEYEALVNHHKRPQKIILSYFINDIQSAAGSNGIHLPKLINEPNKIIRPLVNNSFVLNWFYWRLYRIGTEDTYWNYLKHAYSDTKTWNTHKQELNDIIDFSNQAGSEIVFIVWPNLKNIDGSFEFTSKVVEFLNNKKVGVIDLTTHFQNRDPESLIVNAMDAHPNEKTNMEVAELVYQLLFTKE